MTQLTWAARFAAMSHEDRVMTIVEDGSTLDALIAEASDALALPRDEGWAVRALYAAASWQPERMWSLAGTMERKGGICEAQYLRGIAVRLGAPASPVITPTAKDQ